MRWFLLFFLAFVSYLTYFGSSKVSFWNKHDCNARGSKEKSITILNSNELSSELSETSGLIYYNNYLFSHNDDSDTHLYMIDPTTGKILQRIPLPNIKNIDWEAITQDDQYIYVGDFGNNGTGTRANLTIYIILKSSLIHQPIIEKITFDYENRIPSKTQKANATDYDCEAFIAKGDSLYLFTKEWITQQTTVYVIPKKSGNYVAKKKNTYAVNGLITDAVFEPISDQIILTGYSSKLQPFVVIIHNFSQINIAKNRLKKYKLGLPFHQIEGITILPDKTIYISNERFYRKFIANIPAKLHQISILME